MTLRLAFVFISASLLFSICTFYAFRKNLLPLPSLDFSTSRPLFTFYHLFGSEMNALRSYEWKFFAVELVGIWLWLIGLGSACTCLKWQYNELNIWCSGIFVDELSQVDIAVDMRQRYVGHCNTNTDIKQASFLGERGTSLYSFIHSFSLSFAVFCIGRIGWMACSLFVGQSLEVSPCCLRKRSHWPWDYVSRGIRGQR